MMARNRWAFMTSSLNTVWLKYKQRQVSARQRLHQPSYLITNRANRGENLRGVVEEWSDDEQRIRRRMYLDVVVTKNDWRRAGYPVIPKLDDLPEWRKWRVR